MKVTVAEAAARLPELIAAAQAGEEVIIANDQGAGVRLEIVAAAPVNASDSSTLTEFLRGLPPGTRSREEIDAELTAQRNEWR